MPQVHLDFETFSEIDIKKSGAYRYSIDPSTEVMCLVYQIDDNLPKLWIPCDIHMPEDLEEAIKKGYQVKAHNAFFERCIWENKMVKIHGWIPIKPIQYRCTAAKAASMALPRALKSAGEALGLGATKDGEGSLVMLKMSKPRKPTKNNTSNRHSGFEDFKKLYEYCKNDVLSEYALDLAIPDLSADEQIVWHIDQKINMRGVSVDVELVNLFIKNLNEKKQRGLNRLKEITSGEVESLRQTEKLRVWISGQLGQDIPNVQKATLQELVDTEMLNGKEVHINDKVKEVLKLRESLGKSSVDKYKAFKAAVSPYDNRVRDLLMYHGAATGRFAGKIVQLQNLPRGSFKNTGEVIDDIKKLKDIDSIEEKYGDVAEVASSCLRGCLVASEGKELHVADWSAIEARGLLWIAEDEKGLDVFRRKEDIYVEQAKSLYNNEELTPENKQERQVGKTIVLACGYQMGADTFLSTCDDWKVDIDSIASGEFIKKGVALRQNKEFLLTEMEVDHLELLATELDESDDEPIELCEYYGFRPGIFVAECAVSAYRSRFYKVREFWNDIESAAIRAVVSGKRIDFKRLSFAVEGKFLRMRLPSGRKISYYLPQVKSSATKWGSEKYTLSYMGEKMIGTRKMWTRIDTYGGKLTENAVQGICRDLLAVALVNCEKKGYEVLFHVHDEIATEKEKGKGSYQELEKIMCRPPSWAGGFPIDAEGWTGTRYKK